MFSKKTESVIINYEGLKDWEKEIVEAVYKAYRDATDAKIWRMENGQEVPLCDSVTGEPLPTDACVEVTFNKGKIDTANAWASFTQCVMTNQVSANEAFDKAYLPAARGKNYSGGQLPLFDQLLNIQKNGWVAAAKVAAEVPIKACEEQEPTPQAMRP